MVQERPRGYMKRWYAPDVTVDELRGELTRERKRRLAQRRLLRRDELTRLHTRKAFNSEGRPRFLRSQRGATSVAMFFIDANQFKGVNDTHGHAVGDKLLVAIAQKVKGSVRPADLSGLGNRRRTLAGRKGGDEFVLFFDHLDEAGAHIVATRIHSAVAAIRLKKAPDLRASVSVGVAVGVPPASLGWRGLIEQADAAMYQAKRLRGTDQPTICIRPIIT